MVRMTQTPTPAPTQPQIQVAVCGPSEATPEDEAHAREVGTLLAQRGAVVICGGGPGVMAAVAAGAKSVGGTVVGILPGRGRAGANPDLSLTISTGIGD